MHVQADGSVAQQYAQSIVGSLVGGAPGSSIYGFGNNKGNGEPLAASCFTAHSMRAEQAMCMHSWAACVGAEEMCLRGLQRCLICTLLQSL